MKPSNEPATFIKLVLTQDHRSPEFKTYCRELMGKLPHIGIIKKDVLEAHPPCIQLAENLKYYALPEGMEWMPFTEAIDYLSGNPVQIPEDIQNHIRKIQHPSTLRLFITTHCPTCPPRVRQLIPLAILNPALNLDIIDVALFPEIGEGNGIQGVPTLIINDSFRWAGMSPLEEIISILDNGDISSLNPDTIEEMLRFGSAGKIAEMVLEKGEVFPELADFIIDEKFSTRLGAMVAAEEILKRDGDMSLTLVQAIWERFGMANEQLQEDILYLLGVSGHPEAIKRLQSVRDGNYTDHLKQAAAEIMESSKDN